MNGLAPLWRAAGRPGLALLLLGLFGVVFNTGLVAVVHRALDAGEGRAALALAFVALGLGRALTAYGSGRVAESYSQASVARLRRELIAKLLDVPYQRFERLGAARAHAALTTDIAIVNAALQAGAGFVVNGAVLAGGALYLLHLDPRMFVALLLLAALGLIVHRAMNTRARALLRRARSEQDRVLAHFHALIDGAKELRLNAARRRAFLAGPIRDASEQLLRYGMQASSRFLLAQAVNGLLVLVVIGAVLFVFGGGAAAEGTTSGYVLVALYLTGPLSSLLRLQPLLSAAEIAIGRIHDAGVQLGAPEDPERAEPQVPAGFGQIELRAVTHRYDGRPAFTLGPLSLRIAPGELVLVRGGNGSGKTTLAKLLVGLYEPSEGQLYWDGAAVDATRRDSYRQLFSAVFSEFHVFDRLYGVAGADLDARAGALIDQLGLSRVVRVQDGVLSTLELSTGQRKRLALLAALLEDRPIYVFDEWAAEQDAEFKQVFYLRLLPELRARGKTVIAISHDERWFGVATRSIELRDGRLVAPQPPETLAYPHT
jgi:putative ATP-binding cassette transporter